MTTDVSGTLASIDGALRDFETSGDAMRWAPDAAKREQGNDYTLGLSLLEPYRRFATAPGIVTI